MTSKPALCMSFAYEGGAWKAKQFDDAPHFRSGRLESVSSRLPKAMSAARSGPTTGVIERRPAAGGVPYFEASTVSPTHAMVTRCVLGPGTAAGVVVVDVVAAVDVSAGAPVLSGPLTVRRLSLEVPVSAAAAARGEGGGCPDADAGDGHEQRRAGRAATAQLAAPELRAPRAALHLAARAHASTWKETSSSPACGLHARSTRTRLPSASANSSPARAGAAGDHASTPEMRAVRAPAAAAAASSRARLGAAAGG